VYRLLRSKRFAKRFEGRPLLYLGSPPVERRQKVNRNQKGDEQMKRRRITRLALISLPVVAVVALSLAAVSSGSSNKADAKFGVNATGTVQFWTRAATSGLGVALVKEFNASHPGLKVVLSQTSPNQDTSKLATAIRAHAVPDVVGLNDIDVPQFSRLNALTDITKQVNALAYKKDLSPGHLALAGYNGKYYGVPYLGDLSVLWYNKKLFSQAGLDPNKPPTTFAEILTDSKKIQALGNGVSGFAFAGNCQGCLGFVMEPDLFAVNDQLIRGPIGHQTIAIENNGPLKQLLQLYQQLWSQKLVSPGSRTESGPTWGNDFEAGKVGILPGAYGFYPLIKKAGNLADIGIAPLPGPNGKYSTFDGGDDFVIPSGAKNPSGAWEFIQWVLQKSQQVQYPGLGYTPVRTDVLTSAYKAKNPYNAVALQALAHGSAPVTTVYDAAFNEPNSPWFQMFSQAVYKNDVAGALKTGQSGFERVVKQAGDG
jgi:multiple sugar transport system substrate-binding protein